MYMYLDKQSKYLDMFSILIGEAAITSTVVANILLTLSVQSQRYIKRRAIRFALNGVSTEQLQQWWWHIILPLFVTAECSFFISYGIKSDSLQVISLSVYTAISNIVLPPLFYEYHKHTITGSIISQSAILLLILAGTSVENSQPFFDCSSLSARLAIVAELGFGITCTVLKVYGPTTCTVRLIATSGITSLIGSHVVTVVKLLQETQDFTSQAALMSTMLLGFFLEFMLISQALQYFSALQLIPHHFVLFLTLVFINSSTMFHQTDRVDRLVVMLNYAGYAIMLLGVWIACKPHLDLPIDLVERGNFSNLMDHAYTRWREDRHGTSHTMESQFLDTRWGEDCLRSAYCELFHRSAAENESRDHN